MTDNKSPQTTLIARIKRRTAFLLRLDAAVERQAKADARQRERVRLAIAQRRLEIKLKTGRMVQQ